MDERPVVHRVIDGLALAAASFAGVWGFSADFRGATVFWVGLAAVLVGIALGALGAWRRWSTLTVAAGTTVAYFVLGGVVAFPETEVAGAVPTLATLRELAIGAVSSWKALLTTDVPASPSGVILLVPAIAGLLAGVIASSIALRARRPGWAIVGPAALLVVSIAFGSYLAVAPAAQAALFAGVSLAWLAWRRATQARVSAGGLASESAAPTVRARRRAVSGALVLALAIAGGAMGATVFGAGGQRDVIRDHVTPPLDLHNYPSPLQSYRGYVRDFKDQALFTVDGLPEGARVRLATLDTYDGVVYSVAGSGSAVSGSFTRLHPRADGASGATEIGVTIGALRGVWVPDVGSVSGLQFTGGQAQDLQDALFYDAATGTAINTEGLSEGASYTFTASIPPEVDLSTLDAPFARTPLPDVRNVPETVGALASDIVGSGETDADVAMELARYLAADGYFSHGLEGQAPSLSGHSADRIASLLGADQLIGDDEQYAVAFALMARELGIPVRVVLGFYPDPGAPASDTFVATGSNAHVWAEVDFAGPGWVAVNPVPAEDRTPENEEIPPKREPKPQVLQPPPPPDEPAAAPQAIPTEDLVVAQQGIDASTLFRFLLILVGLLLAVGLVVSPWLVIVASKVRRRLRRRHARRIADRLAGAWEELADYATDLGVLVPAGGTRLERAGAVDSEIPAAGALDVALAADAGIWSPEVPDRALAEDLWVGVDQARSAMRDSFPRRRQLAALVSLRSLARARAGSKRPPLRLKGTSS